VGYFLQKAALGALISFGGIVLLVTVRLLDKYPWMMLVWAGVGTAIGLLLLWDYWQGIRAARALKRKTMELQTMTSALSATANGFDMGEELALNMAGDARVAVVKALNAVKANMKDAQEATSTRGVVQKIRGK
jgi:hypothetical protein